MNTKIDDPKISEVIKNATDWRDAVTALIGYWTEAGQCYTSGEVSAALRTHRPDMRFAVASVGTFVRDMFHDQELPFYVDENGTGVYPWQDMRICAGLYPDRTPAGTEVFVYGPEAEAVQNAEFEIYIPKPGGSMDDAPAPDGNADPTLDSPQAVTAALMMASNYVARVWPDGRLAVPRRALEAAAKLAGTPLHGGAPVFVRQTTSEAEVSLTDPGQGQNPEWKPYTITRSDARVAFNSLDGARPFVPGTTYVCVPSAGNVYIVLNIPAAFDANATTD